MGRTYFIKLPEKGSFGLQNFNDGFDNQIRIFCRNCEIFGKTKTFVNIINFRCLQLSFFLRDHSAIYRQNPGHFFKTAAMLSVQYTLKPDRAH